MRENKLNIKPIICGNERKEIVAGYDEKVNAVMNHAWYEFMDIVLVDFGEIEDDCLIHKARPAIVVSSSKYNINSPVMQVIPMTKKFKNLDSYYHVFVDSEDCENLNASGMAMIEQLTTVDRAHIVHYIGCVVDSRLIAKIQAGIVEQLGLEGC